MVKKLEGGLQANGIRFGITVSRFNDFITGHLLDGALDALMRSGAADENITIVWTPGAFEMPVILKRMAGSGNFDALIALGAVIRGGTPHFDYVAAEVTKGIAQVALESSVPVAMGVLTTDNIEQAIERAGTKAGNKGAEAARAAIEMANLVKLWQ